MPSKKQKTKKQKNYQSKTELLKDIREKINPKHLRVAIFGSARTKKSDTTYKQVYEFAKNLAKKEIDIVTGGGPGIMEAANSGHKAGDTKNKVQSIGLTIELPFEASSNEFVELEEHFKKFSDRLDTFITISHVVVVMPGGIGTTLELFYTWQLTQVRHIYKIPIIVVGEQWKKLIDWVKKYPLERKLMNPEDLDNIHIAKDNKEAIELIQKVYDSYQLLGKDKLNLNINKYGKLVD